MDNETKNMGTSGIAIAGFVLGIISLFLNFGGLTGILATVFSGIGISQTGPGRKSGKDWLSQG